MILNFAEPSAVDERLVYETTDDYLCSLLDFSIALEGFYM